MKFDKELADRELTTWMAMGAWMVRPGRGTFRECRFWDRGVSSYANSLPCVLYDFLKQPEDKNFHNKEYRTAIEAWTDLRQAMKKFGLDIREEWRRHAD